MKLIFTAMNLPIGRMFAASTDAGLARLEFSRTSVRDFGSGLEAEFGVRPARDDDAFSKLRHELESYFSGEPVVFTVRLDVHGTEFQKRVWSALANIPYGNVRSYGWLARMAGSPGAARAVGGALNKNPIPVIIPCHRIVESSGRLGGFGSGVEIKKRLLELEGVLPRSKDQ